MRWPPRGDEDTQGLLLTDLGDDEWGQLERGVPEVGFVGPILIECVDGQGAGTRKCAVEAVAERVQVVGEAVDSRRKGPKEWAYPVRIDSPIVKRTKS